MPSWLLLIVVGVALVVSVVFIPAGIAVLGTLILGAGIFAHIMSPLKIGDWMDAVVGLSGAAITVTFVIAVIGVVAGFGVTVLVSLFRWLAG